MKLNRKIIFCFILVIFINDVYSTSLGSLTKKDYDIVNSGEKARFEILFWNLGDPYYLKLNGKNVPDEWGISIEPNNFYLEKSETLKPPFDGDDYINLPNVGLIKPEKIQIELKIPYNTETGEYNLIFTALSSSSKNEITTSHERDIDLKVKVNGKKLQNSSQIVESQILNQEIPKEIEKDLVKTENINFNISQAELTEKNTVQENSENPLTGRIVSGILENRNLIILLSFIGIILISVVIYKYA